MSTMILKEYFCVYFTGYYKVDYLCLTDDIVLTYILWAELTVIYSIVYLKFTLIYVVKKDCDYSVELTIIHSEK